MRTPIAQLERATRTLIMKISLIIKISIRIQVVLFSIRKNFFSILSNPNIYFFIQIKEAVLENVSKSKDMRYKNNNF